MKLERLRVALILLVALVVVILAGVKWRQWSHGSPPAKNISLLTSTNPSSDQTALHKQSKVIVQTGEERMSNAVRCMLYVVELANNLPKERDGIKRHIAATAGALFFNDSLMAKMSNGYITTTTNELRQSFYSALSQMFSNNIPPEIMQGFDKSFSGPTNFLGDFIGPSQVSRDLVQGFKSSFRDRNNMRVSVDDQYAQMAKSPELARTLTALDSAFQKADITDAEQSDLKEMCLALGESRTSAYLIYGPHSDSPMPAEYQAYMETLDNVLKWRLVNIYGLDEPTAQTFIQALAHIHISGFSHASLQVPALVQ